MHQFKVDILAISQLLPHSTIFSKFKFISVLKEVFKFKIIINTNCYNLCNVRQPVVYSVEGVVKTGEQHDNADTFMSIKMMYQENCDVNVLIFCKIQLRFKGKSCSMGLSIGYICHIHPDLKIMNKINLMSSYL